MRIRRADPLHEGGRTDDAPVLPAHKELIVIVGVNVALVRAVGQNPDGSVRSRHAGLVNQVFVTDGFVAHPDVGAGHLDGAGHVRAQDLADAPGGQLDEPVARFGLLAGPCLGGAHPAPAHQVGPGFAGGADDLGGHGRLHLGGWCPGGGGREAQLLDHEPASLPALQSVVGARVDVADYLGQLAAQLVHGQHVVLELTGFVRGQLVHRLDELLLGAYQPVQGFRGRAVVAGGSRQMADAVVLQVVVAFQRRLVARVAHAPATVALLESLAHASDAGTVHLDQAAAGMVEQVFQFLADSRRSVFDDERRPLGRVPDGSSPQGQDAAHIPLVKMDHLARLLIAAAYLLPPRHTLARKVLQHAQLQGLPFVPPGKHHQVKPDVVKEEMTAQPEPFAGGQYLRQLGRGGPDALLERHRLQRLGSEPLQIAQAPAGGDARPARPVLIAGDGVAPLRPGLEQELAGRGDASVALAPGAEAVPVGKEFAEGDAAARLYFTVAAVHQGEGIVAVVAPDVIPAAHSHRGDAAEGGGIPDGFLLPAIAGAGLPDALAGRIEGQHSVPLHQRQIVHGDIKVHYLKVLLYR